MHMVYSTAPCCFCTSTICDSCQPTDHSCLLLLLFLSAPLPSYPQAPKNPITGEPLTPVTNKDKEGYQASTLAGQSEDTHARIMGQLDAQPGGRSFGGEEAAARLLLVCMLSCGYCSQSAALLCVLLAAEEQRVYMGLMCIAEQGLDNYYISMLLAQSMLACATCICDAFALFGLFLTTSLPCLPCPFCCSLLCCSQRCRPLTVSAPR
jgi:hypothetical protein